MIECEGVGLSYLAGQKVLSDVSLQLKPGSFHFLAGPSGAGKTSLLGLLSLALRASQGTIRILGQEVTRLPRHQLPGLRRKIGTVSQDFRLLGHLTVRENVALPLKIAGEASGAIEMKVQEMLEWIGLKDYPKAMPNQLSGGQKQRVAIARAVINRPRFLLADEPTGNLDAQLGLKIMHLFEAMHRMGTTVLIATHDEHLISLFGYPALRLKEGRLQG